MVENLQHGPTDIWNNVEQAEHNRELLHKL